MTILVIGCGILGLAVGSFLNVVIYRVPRGESVSHPRSHCPRCGKTIRGGDNIPVISWVLLRGRCRHCGEPISIRYPAVEILTGALFAGIGARLGPHVEVAAYLALVAILVALSAVDLEKLILPKRIVYPGLILVSALLIGASAYDHSWGRLETGAACGAVWYAFFFLINLASPRALGFGDVRLAPLLGLALGWFGVWFAVVGFFAANLIGVVIGLALLATGRVARRQPVPYGVFLSLGTLLAIYAGPEIVSWIPPLR